MKWPLSVGLIGLALFATGCGDAAREQTPTGVHIPEVATTSDTAANPETDSQPGSTATTTKTTTTRANKPGVPGSPINFDPTFTGFTVDKSEAYLKDGLRQAGCGPELCQVTITTKPRISKDQYPNCTVQHYEHTDPIRWHTTITMDVNCPTASRSETTTTPEGSR